MHRSRPWSGLLTSLWASSFVKVLAFAAAVMLAVTVGGDGFSGAAAFTREADARRAAEVRARRAAAPAPNQRWGSAAGQGHLSGGAGNKTVPRSLRGQYPLLSLDQQPQAGQDAASVGVVSVVGVRGFDKAASRELPEGRSVYERVYANPDGTQTTEFSTAPVNYRTADGSWAPIDASLVADGSGWRNAADSVDVRLAGNANAGEVARLGFDAEHSFGYGLAGAGAVAGVAAGAAVVYPGLLPQVDLKLESQPGGVKETVVLRSASAPHSYLFPLRLTGLSAAVVGGQVLLTDAAGIRRAVIPAGFMVDAAGASSAGVSYRLTTLGGRRALEVTVDSGWLRDKARAYPVLLDPTVKLPVDGDGADSSMYVYGSSSASGSSELRVGAVDGANSASYITFAGLVSRLRFHTIFGAQLQVVNYDSGSCRARQVTVSPVTVSWSAGTGYSYPGPAVGGSLASKSFAHGYVGLGQSSSSCPAAAELFDLGSAGRNLVQRWVNGDQANYGLSLRAAADAASGKRFAGSGTANPPRLFVTHSPYNASYSIPNPVPDPPVLQNQAGKVKVTVTNKSAEAWTAANYYLAYRAYNAVTGAAVTQQRAASLTSTVARNAKVTLEAAIKALPPGKYFLDFTMVRTGGAVFTDHQVPPGRIVLQVFDIPPVVQELFPNNGYQTPTLTPQLWARALDIDAPPGSALQFKFEVCDNDASNNPVNCTNSGYGTSTAWSVPAGRLVWSKTYQWRAFVKDATTEVPSPYATVLTSVPQPEITSRVAGAPYGTQDKEFDAQTGNFSTAAVDATVSTVGPELNVVRTYNSLDPRRDGGFGAGWSSRYDMKVVADDDGSGNVVVTYPDGQEVRFGKNPDGTYAAPSGRTASLTVDSTSWKLLDKSGTTYQFSLAGRLTRITDVSSRSIVLTYSTTDGRLAKAQVSNSQTNTAGRALTFTWSGAHVATVKTDPVGGAALTWNYTYTGDLLTRVCAPSTACTVYDYSAGSHYRGSVLDSKPESYWRLGESEGASAGSEIAVNLGKDAGTYKTVTLGTAGPIVGSPDTAASFNGTSSYVDLAKGAVKKSHDAAVEVWFKSALTGTGGPLLGYQDKAVGTAATTGVPILYVGTDGKVHGQFATGTIAPIASAGTVNDGKWHHVVLSAMGTTQTMYLDGVKTGELTGASIEQSLLTFNQIGAAYATTPVSWTGWGSTSQRYFTGAIDEVAIYSHPLGSAAVAAHYKYATLQADQLSKVTLPSGKTGSEVTYDVGLDRAKEYTDRNGGTWKIGAPLVYGGDTDLRRSVQVLDPANRPNLYEYDALAGRMLRTGLPLGLVTRDEDQPGQPTPSPTPSTPVETCSTPDPTDPGFCTVIPGSASGPVFVAYDADGVSIRSYSYDDQGNQNVITNENGDTVTMTFDSRGNVTSRKTCRSASECYTSYDTYPATPTNLYDPRNDQPTESRDGRSTSATDTTYRTAFTYHATGQLATQTGPDGSLVQHKYSTGAEAAYGGGIMPPGLLLNTTDARGKVTSYTYYANGDLAQVTDPAGMVTSYTYDALGRKVSETETSDSYPSGVTTTYAYDSMSRVVSATEPATTDAVSGVKHQQSTVTTYDLDGDVTRVDVTDLLGGDAARTTTWEYDDSNRPIRVVDAEGNETNYDYDRFGNRVSMVDACGNRYDYAYTARNTIAEVRLRNWHSDPAGAPATGTGDYLVLHSYSYDYAGRMVSDTDAMGRRLEYLYYGDDLPHRITLKNLHNPDGSTRDYVVEDDTYDGAGNMTKQVTGNGRLVTQNTFDKNGQTLTTVVDPGGLSRGSTFVYDGNGNVTRTTRYGNASNVPWATSTTPDQVDYVYDDAANVTKETVTSGTTTQVSTYTYDRRGLPTSSTDPRGNVSGADPAAYTTNYSHDELGRQVKVTNPPVAAESGGQAASTVRPSQTYGYNTFDEQVEVSDELGNVTRGSYDRVGRQVTATAPSYMAPGALNAITPTTQTKYDAAGNVTEVVDARGNSTRYTYDQLNRLVTKDLPGSTNDERAVWNYTYARTGEVLSVNDPAGARVESTYDDLDRQVTLTSVERRPAANNFSTRYTYDDAGNVISSVSPTGATTVSSYDALGELIKSADPNGVATQHGYDYAGREVRLSDGLGRTSRTTYDPLGRTTSESDLAPDGTVLRSQSYGYDPVGNLLASTDPTNVTTTYQYDAANQLVKQIEPVTATSSVTTSFGYDAAGNRTRYTDGRGNSTIYTVNSLGLPESVVEPATTAQPNAADRTWTAGYDANGNAVRMTAPGAVTRQQTYDAADRLTAQTGTGAEASTTTRTLGYDLVDRLTQASAPGGTDTYAYDDQGHLLSTAGPSGTATFGYDGDGNPTSRTDAAGTARFAYTNGRLATATDGITGTAQTLGYNTAGDLATVNYGSGRVRSFGYDDFGRQTTDVLRNAANQTVSSITYGYDLNDLVTGKTTTGTAGAGTNTYNHDQAGRLTSWTSATGTVQYGWDASGNRTTNGAKTATYDERNRVLSDGDYTYTYTARGTVRSRTSSGLTEQFSFDAFDRLITAAAQNYAYDGLDRVASRNGTAFAYAGQSDQVVSDGTETYARGAVDELLAVATGSDKRLAVGDQHGDVVGEFTPTDTSLASLSDSTSYDPFGKVTAQSGATGNLGYQGDWTDPGTNQVDMGARWYNPGTGGFDSRDSATYSSGDSILANRYTYAAGDPMDYADPDGNWPCFSCAWKKVKSAASSVWSGVRSASSWAWSGISRFSNWVWSGIKTVSNWAWSGIKTAARWVSNGAKWVYNKAKTAITTSYNWVRNKTSQGLAWAKQKAAEARRIALEKAKQVTRVARAAISYAAKHNPLPAIAAALKPALAGLKKVVSAAASLPAAVVSTVRDVVNDVRKSVDVIYQKAIQTVGNVVEAVSTAAKAVSEFTQAAMPYIKAGLNVLADVSGFNDLKNCVTKGDLEACAWTAVTIAGYVAGGAPGAEIRALRAGTLAAKHGDEAIDLVRAGSKLANGADDLKDTSKLNDSVDAASCLGAANSFTGDTQVRMADGSTKPISEVHEGDSVLATDPTTGRTSGEQVTNVIVGSGQKNLVEINVDSGTGTEKVTATEGHPFWVESENRWVDAKDLKPGYQLETADHRPVTVVGTRSWTQRQTVYNLTVDTLHTFYVVAGGTDLLVHNQGGFNDICPKHDLNMKGVSCNGKGPSCPSRRIGNEEPRQDPGDLKTRQEEEEAQRAARAKAITSGAKQLNSGLGDMVHHVQDYLNGLILGLSAVGTATAQGVRKARSAYQRWRDARRGLP